MKFTIIHASYGRKDMAYQTLRKWYDNHSRTDRNFGYYLSFDKCDPEYHRYYNLAFELNCSYCSSPGSTPFHFIENDTNTSVSAINAAAKRVFDNEYNDIIIVTSDDFEPLPNWDLEILKAVEGKEDWILKTQDGTQPWIITLPIMDRKYYERFGYVYHPDYTHMFCDTEMSAVADMTGRRITSNLLFKHNHYSVGGIKRDATSDKADKTWKQGQDTFLRRYENKFDVINPLPSKMADNTVRWIKNNLK